MTEDKQRHNITVSSFSSHASLETVENSKFKLAHSAFCYPLVRSLSIVYTWGIFAVFVLQNPFINILAMETSEEKLYKLEASHLWSTKDFTKR